MMKHTMSLQKKGVDDEDDQYPKEIFSGHETQHAS